MLNKIAKVFKDYCGLLSEEAIRKNFILLYELLDEMIDYGYPQVTATESLKMFVYNAAIQTTGPSLAPGSKALSGSGKTASASSVQKPIAGGVNQKAENKSSKNEIFVDILERLNVLFSPNGYILNSTIDGCIQMKSYLAGNPQLRLALNEDLVIGNMGPNGQMHSPNDNNNNQHGAVVLDGVNFNDCVNLSEFESQRTLTFYPPDGEFVVLNYRMKSSAPPPFKMFPAIEETSPLKLELTITVRAEMPTENYGANVCIRVPLPRCTSGVFCQLNNAEGQNAEYVNNEKRVVWNVKKFQGGTSMTLKCKITLAQPCTTNIRKEIGPISMDFEIPMFNVSRLNVRYLRIAETTKNYDPFRWVRYVTQTSSYICRL